MRDRRRQWIALMLSGIFPGLGQFYARAWGRGAAFLIAGAAATWALGWLISVEDLLAGHVAYPALTLGLTAGLLALFLWSIIDAWRSAGRTPK